jgi:hypothetical protein
MKGSVSLDQALAQVEEAKRQADSAEAKLIRLQTEAPDLAVRVATSNYEIFVMWQTLLVRRRPVIRRRARA